MWSNALAACDESVAAVFDEIDATATARRAGLSVNDLSVDDPSRPAFAFKASISLSPPATGRADIYDPGTRGERAVSHAAVLTAHSATWPWIPVREDLIEANGTQWHIVAVDRHGSDRFVAYLNKAR